jgi:hypothetical protein
MSEEYDYDPEDNPWDDYCKSMEQDSKDQMIDEYIRSGRKDDEFEIEMGLK